MTLEQASNLSGIRLEVIKSLEGTTDFLPKSLDTVIYRNGFIKSYAKFLGLNPEYAIAIDRRSNDSQVQTNNIPINPKKNVNKNLILIISIILIIISVGIYGYLQWLRVNISPEIFITQPRVLSLYSDDSDHHTEDSIVLNLPEWTLAGKIDRDNELTINSTKIPTNQLGEFQIRVNSIIRETKVFDIQVKNRFGNISSIKLIVNRLE